MYLFFGIKLHKYIAYASVQFSGSVTSNSLQPRGLQHARPPCLSTTPGDCSNSCPSSRWCHPTIKASSSFYYFIHIHTFTFIHEVVKASKWGFPGGVSGKEPTRQSRRRKRHGFDPWVGKIPRRRAWQPTPGFMPGESHGQRSLKHYSL